MSRLGSWHPLCFVSSWRLLSFCVKLETVESVEPRTICSRNCCILGLVKSMVFSTSAPNWQLSSACNHIAPAAYRTATNASLFKREARAYVCRKPRLLRVL